MFSWLLPSSHLLLNSGKLIASEMIAGKPIWPLFSCAHAKADDDDVQGANSVMDVKDSPEPLLPPLLLCLQEVGCVDEVSDLEWLKG